MKKIFITICLLLSAILMPNLCGRTANAINSTPLEANIAYKGMFSIVTYSEDNHILHSGYGFFIDPNGTGVASFSMFKNAYRADVIDFKGNKYPVYRILGASSNYDLVKFSIEVDKETQRFEIATDYDLVENSPTNLVRYSGKKKMAPIPVKIETAQDFEDFKYYSINAENTENNLGCPLLDETGHVVAITQKNVDEKARTACAIDARFLTRLNISSTSLLSADLNAINIIKGIPSSEKEALTYIYMLGFKDSVKTLCAMNDFITCYPENAEGYVNRGTFYANYKNFELCQNDFDKAIELADNESSTIKSDEIHNNLSKVIYNSIINNGQQDIAGWNIDHAIEEAGKAFEITPSPYYLLQQGHCYFTKKEYMKAYNNYTKVNSAQFNNGEWSPQAKSETWLFAARAYEMAMKNDEIEPTIHDSLHLITLLDSAINTLPQPYNAASAAYFLERAQRNEAVNQYRKAVMDYYEYEKIIGPKNLNDKFYYLREQAEIKCHMYQQALDDIQTAISFNPQDPFYPIEKAVVLLQAGMYQEAITTCEESLTKLPENPDCYKIMGIAYGELNDTKKAQECLKKAKDLGDPTIDTFIQKYQ